MLGPLQPVKRLDSVREDSPGFYEDSSGSHEITRILQELHKGQKRSTDELIPLVYDELRHLAAYRMAKEKPGQTLQPTALVHEAYLKLIGPNGETWANRRHFFAAAAEAMRRILTESARRKNTLKRGGNLKRVEIDPDELPYIPPGVNLLDLDAALEKLDEAYPESAGLVKLRYFAGLTLEQIASVLDVSPRTAENRWVFAKAWLYRRLNEAGE